MDNKKDLYSLVQEATQGNTNMNKVQLGYTVDSYKGVLSKLKQINANASREIAESAYGDDYSEFDNIRFDDSGFSKHGTACLWRNEVLLLGSLPIQYQNLSNGIIKVKGCTQEMMAKTETQQQFPLELTNDICAGVEDSWKFPSGVYIDIERAWKYFEKFFRNGDKQITAECVSKLIRNKCLMAQIINPNGSGSSCEVLVIGKSPMSSSESITRMYLSPSLFPANVLNQLNLPINISGQGKTIQFIPEKAGDYHCLILNSSYDAKSGTIEKFDLKKCREWARNNGQQTGQADCLEIDQFQNVTFPIRLYIPQEKKEQALSILGTGVSDAIFKKYITGRYGAGNIPAGLNADVTRMMQCITDACVEFGCKLYKKSDISPGGSGNAGRMSGNGNWIRSHGQATAMEGYFIIPKGWPMCRINQNYGNRSGAVQRKKKHPKQGSGDPVPWIEWVAIEQTDTGSLETRMDSGLQKLDSSALRGEKSLEWYNKRLERSNFGGILIYCNSKVASKWQEVFNKSWAVYASAASKYNTGRPSDEHVSAGEIILRCAPCLCCINGTSGIHRARPGRENSGHECGQAIDFAPDINGTTTDISTNYKTHFAENLEVGYRPWFHYLFEVGGGWGGSYKFMSKAGKFDAMHFQIY